MWTDMSSAQSPRNADNDELTRGERKSASRGRRGASPRGCPGVGGIADIEVGFALNNRMRTTQ
jgi:hypothetical protein